VRPAPLRHSRRTDYLRTARLRPEGGWPVRFCDDGWVSTKAAITVSATLIVVATLVGIALYPQLPDPMPAHWDAAGNVDGYIARAWGVFLFPVLTAGLAVLLFAVPHMDPERANIESFRGAYNTFAVGFVVFMLLVYGLMLAAGLGHEIRITLVIMPAMGVLFLGIGRLLRSARHNYSIGIRTPWTLASEEVWDATHALAGRTFTVGGIVAILAAFLGEAGFWLMMAGLLGAALVPVGYSYALWVRLGRPEPDA
jgi:uncharacterized membrane protein